MGRFPALQELLFSSFERRVLSASFFLSVRLIRLRDTFLIQETLSTTRGELKLSFTLICLSVMKCRPVQGGSGLSPNVSRDWLQLPSRGRAVDGVLNTQCKTFTAVKAAKLKII